MYSNSHINKAAFSFLKTNQNNNIKTQKRNYQKSLLQNIPLKQKELLKIKKQGNVKNMSFFSYKTRLRCRFSVIRISGRGGCSTGSGLAVINPTLDQAAFIIFLLSLFWSIMYKACQLSSIFFINSCIFLTIFPSQ